MGIDPHSLVAVGVDEEGGVHEHRESAPASEDLASPLRRLFARVADSLDRDREPPAAVVFDVSAALDYRDPPPITVVRIIPRPPIDAEQELAIDSRVFEVSTVAHIAGGHSALGDELAPLDLESLIELAAGSEPGARYAITSVGSLIHPEHEISAERLLSSYPQTTRVEGSRTFHSSSFAVRERTALMNHALLPKAESLGTSIGLISGEFFPRARLYVTTNDGGRAPLSRLAITPVHSLFAGRPAELVGAAALCGIQEGQLIVSCGSELFGGEMLGGVPAVIPFAPRSPVGRLATQTANIRVIDPRQLAERLRRPLSSQAPPTLVVQGDRIAPEPLSGLPRLRTQFDLRALGAACSSHTEWVNRFIRIANAEEMSKELAAGEAQVSARLIAAGASPARTRIVESHLAATAYETPNVVAVRVRGAAGGPPELDGRKVPR